MNNSCDEKLSKSIKNIENTLNSIKDRLEKKEKNNDFVVYKASFTKIPYIIVLCILTIFSGIILGKYLLNFKKINDLNCSDIIITSQQIIKEQVPDDTISAIKFEMNTGWKADLVFNHIIILIYIVMVGIVVFFLCHVIATDDNKIKFDKLNELHSLRMQTLKEVSGSNDLQDYEITEEETNTGKSNNKKSVKTITKKKNLNTELIKIYMNSITEI